MSTRRAEIFATLARTFAELAELVLDAAGVVDLASERARRSR